MKTIAEKNEIFASIPTAEGKMTQEIWTTLTLAQKTVWNNHVKGIRKAKRSDNRAAHDWVKAISEIAVRPIGSRVHWKMSSKDFHAAVEPQIIAAGAQKNDFTYSCYTMIVGDILLFVRHISQVGKGALDVEVMTPAVLEKKIYDSEHCEFSHEFG